MTRIGRHAPVRAGVVVGILLASGCVAGGAAPAAEVAQQDLAALAPLSWIDTHVHLWSHTRIDDYVTLQDRAGMSRMVLLSPAMPDSLLRRARPNRNAEGLLAKASHPDRFYFFGGLDLTPILTSNAAFAADLGAQLDELAGAGADGIKLYFRETIVEGLRGLSCRRGECFEYLPDNPALAPLFRGAAARGLPVLVHLDERYLAHAPRALAMYPDVTWIVTHMGWAQTDIGRLEQIVGASSRTYVDIGHFVHLGEVLPARAEAIDFFTRHADRVFQSSDLASGCDGWGLDDDHCPNDTMAAQQLYNVRAMLETDRWIDFVSAYTGESMSVRGLALPTEVLRPMYHDNAQRLLGDPRPSDCTAGLVHIDRSLAHTQAADDLARLADIRRAFVEVCPARR